jgi:hypothetical protein
MHGGLDRPLGAGVADGRLRALGQGAPAQPVTFCENYVPWQDKLRDLVDELDFISLHTYPVWEYKPIHEALEHTKANVASVTSRYTPQARRHHRGRLVHPQQRARHARRACAARIAGPLLPGAGGLDA